MCTPVGVHKRHADNHRGLPGCYGGYRRRIRQKGWLKVGLSHRAMVRLNEAALYQPRKWPIMLPAVSGRCEGYTARLWLGGIMGIILSLRVI
jgi:hypothetical protein